MLRCSRQHGVETHSRGSAVHHAADQELWYLFAGQKILQADASFHTLTLSHLWGGTSWKYDWICYDFTWKPWEYEKLQCHDIMLHLTVSPWPRIVSYGDSAYLAIALEGHGYRVACSEAAEILGNESVQEITWLDDVLLEMQILGSCAISFWVTFAVWICISILPDFKNPYSDRSSTARAFCRCSFWSCVFYCVSSVDLRYHDLSSCPALSPFFKSLSPSGLLQSIVDSNRDLVL